MKTEKNYANKSLAIYAIIIAIYVAICTLLSSFSFGVIQIRIAELLLVLCLESKKCILPITLGCLFANIIGVINGTNPFVLDIIIGTIATLLSCILVYSCRRILWFNRPILSLLIPCFINGIMVGYELSLYINMELYLLILYVGFGEFISVCILGLLLYRPIIKAIKPYLE